MDIRLAFEERFKISAQHGQIYIFQYVQEKERNKDHLGEMGLPSEIFQAKYRW